MSGNETALVTDSDELYIDWVIHCLMEICDLYRLMHFTKHLFLLYVKQIVYISLSIVCGFRSAFIFL